MINCLYLFGLFVGVCICYEGYVGADCSFNASDPPSINGKGQLIKTTNSRGITLVVIFGDGFIEGENLTCQIIKNNVSLIVKILLVAQLTVQTRIQKYLSDFYVSLFIFSLL